MKKIVLTTFGSYGDLNPYLTLGIILKKAGYKVAISTILLYKEKVESIGCEFIIMRPNIDEIGPEEEWTKSVNDNLRGTEFVSRKLIVPYINENYEILMTATEDCDLIISHLLTFAAPIVAEKRGIPWISCILQPSTFLSSYDPPALGLAPNLPKYKFLGSAFFYLLFNTFAFTTKHWFKSINELRLSIGLPKSNTNPLMKHFSPYGTLALFSKSFAKPQKDWPVNTSQPGFPLFADSDNTISETVSDYLKKGDAPFVFTLGTAIVQMESDFFKIAYKAIKKTRFRAIFLIGNRSEHITNDILIDDQVCISSYESFPALFPKCKAIVHQCGIGTTSQALFSGRPQILIPFAHDQPDNAFKVSELGCGVKILAKNLSVEKLYKAITEVTGNEKYSHNSRKFKELLLKDNFETDLLNAVNSILKKESDSRSK